MPKGKTRPWSSIRYSGRGEGVRSASFYHTNRWKEASRRFLIEHPLCAECQRNGVLKAANVTDHIVPRVICKDPWDDSNWQPLCYDCHTKKSAKDKKMINEKK